MADGALARLGRWAFHRRWWVLAAWVIVAVLGGLAAGPVFSGLAQRNDPERIESIEAYEVVSADRENGGEVVGLVDRVDLESPAVRSVITAAAADLSGISGVGAVTHSYAPPQQPPRGGALRSTDGRALIVLIQLADLEQPERDAAIDAVEVRLDRLGTDLVAAGQRDAVVSVGGGPVLNREANAAAQADIQRAELISLPVTLVVLVIVFGGLVAAGLPVLAAVVSVASAMTVLLGFSTFTELDSNTVTVVTLLGLGLSVDYGLLLVARYREELAAGFAADAAVGRAWATAGRTILFSALIIAAALSGLLMFNLPGLSAMGAAGVSIALVSMLVSLTFTAAMIGVVRRRIKPSARARRAAASGSGVAASGGGEVGFFARLARAVQRRPLLVALGTAALLLAAGAPLLTTNIELAGLEQIPRSLESIRVSDELDARFGRAASPAVTVVARTDAATLDGWAARWSGDPDVAGVEPARPVGPNVAMLDLNVAGDSQSAAARAVVERVRADRPPGVESWVTGDAAVLTDLLGVIRDGLPAAVGVTVLAMVLLLFAMTGSFVVPLKAVLANVVSLGATFGVLNLVFERGFLEGPLHTLPPGALDPFVIVIVFAFAFGLSMDYEVFLLGRVKEYVDLGLDTDTAVRRGLQHTGRIITSAALLMIIVFGAFAGAKMGQIEQVGLGLAVAVLIDATIVRCLLVPATMTLLGRWNWWAPRWARWLHRRVGLRERVLPAGPGPTGPDVDGVDLDRTDLTTAGDRD